MEETILIECSRESSLEGTTGNYSTLAEWTCDCGDGLVLDIGDKISIHSGFVSEKGAQAGEIEIKERDRKNTVNLNLSKDIDYREKFKLTLPTTSDQTVSVEEAYEYAAELGGNEDVPIQLNDGETNFVYSPYKTANGEFYATLPRRHIGLNPTIYNEDGLQGTIFDTFDCNQGDFVANYNLGTANVGNVRYGNLSGTEPSYEFGFTDAWQFCPADYKLTVLNNSLSLDPANAPTGNYTRRKGMIKNDNSRYTIFRAKSVYRSASAAEAVGGDKFANLGGAASSVPNNSSWNGSATFDAIDLRDPAILYDWDQVRNLVTLKSKTGFNKPEDVASELTQQLNLRGEAIEQKIIHRISSTGGTVNKYADKTLYKYYDSPCYKGYNCASSLWNYLSWYDFTDVIFDTDNDNKRLNNAHLHMSMYQHIGIKRPELHIQGRATNASQGFLKSATGDARNTPQNAECFNTGLEWTKQNLDKLNDLFNVQEKYPELFTGVTQHGPHSESPKINHPITPGHHRFLHFNKQDEWTTSAYHASGHYRHNPKNSLGYDLYGFEATEQESTLPPLPSTGFYHYDETMATYPIFFDYNEDVKNLGINDVGYCEDANGGISDINDLAYGWARKMRKDASVSVSGVDKFYIGLQFTKTGNGVPEFLYNGLTHIALSSIAENAGRRFGWDYHFSAYGNPCMILYSGLVNTILPTATDAVGPWCYDYKRDFRVVSTLDDYNASTVRDSGPMYHKLQLGADEPAIGYNPDEERFFFTNLHMSERLGNPGDAGSTNASGNPNVDANPNADTKCYKINKRMLGTSYCPNVAPYNTQLAIPAELPPYPQQIGFSNNLEPYTPYDAQGGLFIEEVGVPESIWDENLLGVLGFQYSQFNNTDTTRQTTINDRMNATNLKSLTTQAPINVEDLLGWNKNGFGNSIYTLGPPLVYERKANKSVVTDFRGLYPAATTILDSDNNRDSTKITALELPTKTAKPYYAIRSDIIPQNNFLGGNQDLVKATAGAVNRPVIGIVNKINGYGDFYSQESSQLNFTNTMKRVITQIKTSIHDPNGTYSKVNKSSSVIYKITKTKQIDLTPVQTLLESKKKSDIMIADAAASMLKDPEDAKPNYKYAFSNQ